MVFLVSNIEYLSILLLSILSYLKTSSLSHMYFHMLYISNIFSIRLTITHSITRTSRMSNNIIITMACMRRDCVIISSNLKLSWALVYDLKFDISRE